MRTRISVKVAVGLVAYAPLFVPPPQTLAVDEKQEPGALFEKRCSKCHDLAKTNPETC
ncbi:MAG: hypothetical protein JXL84_01630 [Deltaproteobacteria bacterium]|nr:hypothetical protein [Deltaproteobacteria bacterium]